MYAKSVLEAISRFHGELTAFRQDMHAHPELGFQEIRASDRVAKALTALGYQVHRNVGKTGVVEVLAGTSNSSGRPIGLRDDNRSEDGRVGHKCVIRG